MRNGPRQPMTTARSPVLAGHAAPQALRTFDAGDIVGVLTDIDDTMTSNGQLTAAAYRALCDLHAAGLAIIPVTGRSAGWAHMVAKTWPITAVVAESGGLYLAPHHDRRGATARLRMVFHDDPATIALARRRLARCAERIMQAVAGLQPASDNPFRLVDLALDYCEEVPRLGAEQVERAIAMFRAAGFSARASSVHINAWSGEFDKAPMAIRAIRELLPARRYGNPDRWAFIGDAPNDASMFASFRNSVGVANIVPSLSQLVVPPRFLTRAASGLGFAEFARHIIAAKSLKPRRPRHH